MRKLVDILVSLAALLILLGVVVRFFTPNMGFALGQSYVTPLFLWRGAMAFLVIAAALILRQIRDKDSTK
jgi:hypothetical protein